MALPQITLTGRLTKDPDLRFTPSGVAVAKLGVACNDRVKDKQTGEWGDGPPCFLDVTVWKGLAENCMEQLRKGSLVTMTGVLKLDTWDGPDGGKRSKHTMVASEVAQTLLAGAPASDRPPTTTTGRAVPDDEPPF